MLPNAYKQWNDALAQRFFSPERAGKNVYLYVNHDLIKALEQSLVGAGPFLDTVVGRDIGYNASGVCQRALRAFRYWGYSREGFPPYIAYLSLFVLAGDIDGDFAPNAYYPRLWELLGEQRTGTVPSFNLMSQLWDDLEDWTVRDKGGEVGIFQSRSIGGNLHIGYPLSQSILAEQDRRALPQVFYSAGLDPAAFHPAGEIAMALRSGTARRLMRARTVRLASEPSDVLHMAMVDVVSDELAGWDGIVSEAEMDRPGRSFQFAGLRICISIDSVAGIARSSLRCKLNREFPEAGFTLSNGFRAGEEVNGWSLPIQHSTTGEHLDASNLDWRNGVTMRATSPACQLRLPGREVRIFVSGLQEGIGDLVETQVLPRGQSFYICYPQDSWPRLERWATSQCRRFRTVDLVQGIPESWRMARVDEAIDDEAVRHAFPSLSFPSEVRLRLVGGIRSGPGNNFFNFAPPVIELLGVTPETKVLCDEVLLSPGPEPNFVALPSNITPGSRVVVEACLGQTVMQRLPLFLTGDFSVHMPEPLLALDSMGAAVQPGVEGLSCAGAFINSDVPMLVRSAEGVFQDLENEIGRVQGFLVGRNPGEVVAWPSDPFPGDWIPQWAIRRLSRKRWEAVYIAGVLGSTASQPLSQPTARKVRDWKQALWYRRKRTVPPRLPVERELWDQIQRVARNV